jgi:branched-subunit amino acid aminotransferase/4-amino-4-deoxychorismate lyase
MARYLDAKFKRYVEEFSVANFCGITRDGRYVTPTSDTILASTTNIMLQQARHRCCCASACRLLFCFRFCY